jgi:hypothetical protein
MMVAEVERLLLLMLEAPQRILASLACWMLVDLTALRVVVGAQNGQVTDSSKVASLAKGVYLKSRSR